MLNKVKTETFHDSTIERNGQTGDRLNLTIRILQEIM